MANCAPSLPQGNLANKRLSFIRQHSEPLVCPSPTKITTEINHPRDIEFPIGIDLGTKHCCVAVSVKNKIEVIPNTSGKHTTPSYVSFEAKGSITIGEVAKTRAFQNPQYTIFDSKRMIGRNMSDANLKRALKDWPFNIATSDKNQPRIHVTNDLLTPEQVSSKLVKYCLELAEKHLGGRVTKAVITIPAYFNENQKRATIKAGKLAGLEHIDLLVEPTAAAIAYRYNRVHDDPKRVLIFDLGAGTFDIAIVDVTEDKIEILGDGGDPFLGGDDFDSVLIDYCIKEFNAQNNVDIRDPNSNPKHLRSLSLIREECERRKIDLSKSDQASIIVPCVFKEIDMDISITREKYEELIQPLVDKLMHLVHNTLQEKHISKDQIEDIVLVGASTRTPKIQESLQNLFNGKLLNSAINPDDAVAYGAAVHAACLHSKEAKKTYGIELVQVVSISFGVKSISGDNDDHFAPIIPRGTAYPVTKSMEFRTHEDNQDRATISVYQGEDLLASNNVLIGTFELRDIPRNKAREELITVSMQLDGNGLLRVTATSINGSSSNHIDINVHRI